MTQVSGESVEVGQFWKRKDGVVYKIASERCVGSTRDVCLVPVFIPDGVRARRSWKFDAAVAFEFDRVEETEVKDE